MSDIPGAPVPPTWTNCLFGAIASLVRDLAALADDSVRVHDSVERQAVLNQATGMLMVAYRIDAAQAWEKIERLAVRMHMDPHQMAQSIVSSSAPASAVAGHEAPRRTTKLITQRRPHS